MTARADILIIGAGLAGLVAARALTEAGATVTVLDKGRSVGGRLATRRIGLGRADHGAQFFTTRDARFRAMVDRWRDDDLVYEWARGWSDGDRPAIPDGYPRYAAREGMNALAKRLAVGLDARVNVTVSAVTRDADGWTATDQHGDAFHARALILTPPAPQSLALLRAGNVTLSDHAHAALERVTYAPTLTGIMAIDGAVAIPSPGAIQRLDRPVSWIADNQAKGVSPTPVIVANLNWDESRAHWETPDDGVRALIQPAIAPYLQPGATIAAWEIKRWRYAIPTVLHPEPCLVDRAGPPVVFAGDAFAGPRVEGAALSGLTAAEALRQIGVS